MQGRFKIRKNNVIHNINRSAVRILMIIAIDKKEMPDKIQYLFII